MTSLDAKVQSLINTHNVINEGIKQIINDIIDATKKKQESLNSQLEVKQENVETDVNNSPTPSCSHDDNLMKEHLESFEHKIKAMLEEHLKEIKSEHSSITSMVNDLGGKHQMIEQSLEEMKKKLEDYINEQSQENTKILEILNKLDDNASIRSAEPEYSGSPPSSQSPSPDSDNRIKRFMNDDDDDETERKRLRSDGNDTFEDSLFSEFGEEDDGDNAISETESTKTKGMGCVIS